MNKAIGLLSMLMVASCSVPRPEAPTWETPFTIPLLAKTVRVRDLIQAETELLWGDYGPFRLMDPDSVLTSQVLLTVPADEATLQGLPSDTEASFPLGPVEREGNPLDELVEPEFRRAWVEVVVTHSLPGSVTSSVTVEAWDDQGLPSEPLELEIAAPGWSSGEAVRVCSLWTEKEVLAFVNPTASHGVPDRYQVEATCLYRATGRPVSPGDSLVVEVSILTALDLSFKESVLLTRADVQELTISPEGEGRAEGDVSGDITQHLQRVTISTSVWNNIPAGGEATLRLARDSLRLWDDPEVLAGPFEIAAAPFDPETGRPTGTTPSHSETVLTSDEIGIFQNPGPDYVTLYAAVEYSLEGTEMQPVCICAPDSLRCYARAELLLFTDPDDEL